MSWSLAALVGVAGGGVGLIVIIVLLFCLFLPRNGALSNKNSDTGSSDPSSLEWNRVGRISCAANEHQGARKFSLQELEQATRNFSECNLVGQGNFGLVYKGLLLDGTVVAIKKRAGAPRKEFVDEVHHLSEITNRNLVTLFGYCQESGVQIIIFEYLPNGSICNHLYENGHDSTTKLEFKQRLSIAIGAAKGLSHLHSLQPPLVHKNFRTSNVLVDENFIAKVADAGVGKLLRRIQDVDPSQTSAIDVFHDPEVQDFGELSESSDVYSFGAFLLELIAGQDVRKLFTPEANRNLAQWVEALGGSNFPIDKRLGSSYTREGMDELIWVTRRCLDLSQRRRPKMETVMRELDRILEKEMTLTTIMGDGTAIVTLGSQLFSS